MKRLFASLTALLLCLAVLSACGGVPKSEGSGPASSGPSAEPSRPSPGESGDGAVITCRIVSVDQGGGTLTLAKQDGGGADVYRLPMGDFAVSYEDGSDNGEDRAPMAGALAEVTFSGEIMETFPAQLAGVTGILILSGGFDDRCALYNQVLEDLWAVDSGLNSGITELGVDLSQTSLTAAEQAAVAWDFGTAHGILPVQGTYDQLVEQGYIDGENLYWEKGCLFSIVEKLMEGSYSLTPVTFDAEKWRSGLGAYFFMDCTAVQSAGGEWGDYQVGSQAIS